jgi:PIN domain nuclease of toxin-antitoxin system
MNQVNFVQLVDQYVCDAHTLIWFLTKDNRLGIKAKEILKTAEKESNIYILVPIIVLMEILSVVERKNINVSLEEVLQFIEFHSNFIISPIDTEVFKEIMKANRDLELHDRTIVALANLHGAVILTKDKKMQKIYKDTLW